MYYLRTGIPLANPRRGATCTPRLLTSPAQAMADFLASIYGTEKDKVNCSFFLKVGAARARGAVDLNAQIGACRHGDRCSRLHNQPTFSQACRTSGNMYRVLMARRPSACRTSTRTRPTRRLVTASPRVAALMSAGASLTDQQQIQLFDDFFEDVYVEMVDKYGPVEELHICDNLGEHLIGNVYVRFRSEDDADKAVADLNNRWFAGAPVMAELSPVTDFREACCRCATDRIHSFFCSHKYQYDERVVMDADAPQPVRAERVHARRLLQLHASQAVF